MTLKECYDALGGNYEDTVRRLYNEKLVEKFLFKFEEDPSFENLKKHWRRKIWKLRFVRLIL